MLKWCLTKSYQPDGSFKMSDLDDTQGDAFRYGIWFLQEAGYFQSKDRFWTDQDFPDSKAVHDQIEAKLRSIGLNDPALKEAYDTLMPWISQATLQVLGGLPAIRNFAVVFASKRQ